MARYPRKILSNTYTAPAKAGAVGVWNMVEELQARTSDTWPVFVTTPTSIDLLVVAGGGGGGGNHGGGGGAGGLLYGTYSVSPSTSYTVTVGAGGNPSSSAALGTNGSNSVFDTATALGGGRGGSYGRNASGASGGSGAGGTARSGILTGASATQGNSGGLTGYGNAGGDANITGDYPAGGGGGAGVAGSNAGAGGPGGNGGNGRQYDISGTSAYYAGGGGGCGTYDAGTPGTGGLGGGGNGRSDSNPAYSGSSATGGGGGGSRDSTGGSGGSGIVILRYPDTYTAATSTTGSPTYTVSGGYRIYEWTSSGSITW